MENSLVTAGDGMGGGGGAVVKGEMGPEGSVRGRTKTTLEILVVMEMSCIFTLSMSKSCL